MTPKQQERLKSKIKKIKADLAADKKLWGGQYHDGGGLRYLAPRLYVELNDYTGGLRYFNWFMKIFPDDAGYPEFLFEWTIILFKTHRLREAELKAFETFCRNTYLFDVFFGRQIVPIIKWEGSNLETQAFAENYFFYNAKQEQLSDFSAWLDQLISSEKFMVFTSKFLEIQQRLETTHDFETRRYLCLQGRQLLNEL